LNRGKSIGRPGRPVEGIFERVKNIFGVTAGQKSVNLKLVMPSGDDVSGDRKMLERVLDNLVGNAIKFTPSGGTITVTALREHKRTIFSVSDTGRGIPKERSPHLRQVPAGPARRRSAGYGLGLAVVKFIVEAHKGEIRLESEVEKGSTFTFWITDQPVTAKPKPSARRTHPESPKGPSLLGLLGNPKMSLKLMSL